MRKAELHRKTGETDIDIGINIDGTGKSNIKTPIGFLTHMLETFAKHSGFDIRARITGDIDVDQHHTVEDTGIVLGEVIKKALGEKKGIKRAGFFIFPMDEVLTLSSVDISGRAFLVHDIPFEDKFTGGFQNDLLIDFLRAFSGTLGASIHVKVFYGRSDHHKIESVFKSLARALKEAVSVEYGMEDMVPSTKGVL